MARPLRIEYQGALYHVTARGNERRKTFFSRRDYEKFLEYVDDFVDLLVRPDVPEGAWCKR